MNPEFLRLSRLELTPMRLMGAPLLIIIISLYAAADARVVQEPLRLVQEVVGATFWMLLVVVSFWGARRAADTVASEIRGRTWDTQRLSGVSPTSMAMGKLFGGPIGAWYAIGFMIGLQVLVLTIWGDALNNAWLMPHSYRFDWSGVAAEIAGAFAVFSAALFVSMTALSDQDRPRAFDTTLFQLLPVVAGMLLTVSMIDLGRVKSGPMFWGVRMSNSSALAMSFAYFGLWSALGVWSQMRKAFGVETTAIVWIAFLVSLPFYLLGWGDTPWKFPAFFGVAATAYGAALLEPHRTIEWRSWVGKLRNGRASALLQAPAWIYAYVATAAITAYLYPNFLRETADSISVGYLAPHWAPIAALLFVLRDMLICWWAGARARDGRGLWTAVLILSVLWIFLPSIESGILRGGTPQIFLPLSGVSVASMALQVLIAAIAVRGVLRSSSRPEEDAHAH